MEKNEQQYLQVAQQRLARWYKRSKWSVFFMGAAWFIPGLIVLYVSCTPLVSFASPDAISDAMININALFLGKPWIGVLFGCAFMLRGSLAWKFPRKYFLFARGPFAGYPDAYLKYALPLFCIMGLFWLFNIPTPVMLKYLCQLSGLVCVVTFNWWWFFRCNRPPTRYPKKRRRNPATGLPMYGNVDVAGHTYGGSD